VPAEENITFLKQSGVITPIKVCKVGVNLARFNFSREDEKEIFYRYYNEDKNKNIYKLMMMHCSSMLEIMKKGNNEEEGVKENKGN
jgi:hypothetical protein